MNPLYSEAESQGVDYLAGLVNDLHAVTRRAIEASHDTPDVMR